MIIKIKNKDIELTGRKEVLSLVILKRQKDK